MATLTLWESHAIVRYLSAEYGRGLLFPKRPRATVPWSISGPTGPRRRFQPAWIGVFWTKVRTTAEQPDAAAIAKAGDEAARCFDILEQRLAGCRISAATS